MKEQDYDAWAVVTAHEIVMRQGLELALAAQNLNRQGTLSSRNRLMDAISASLLEARQYATATATIPRTAYG